MQILKDADNLTQSAMRVNVTRINFIRMCGVVGVV